MLYIWVDDIRPFPYSSWETNGQTWFFTHTTNEAVNFIRQEYKKGNANFYLDIDNDSGDYINEGGDYINILKRLEDMRNNGHIRNMSLTIKIHSMNSVAVQNMRAIINHNSSWMTETF